MSSEEDHGEWLARLRSVGQSGRASRQQVREYRDGQVAVKEVTDEHGNITTYRNTGDTESVGVEIRPQTVQVLAGGFPFGPPRPERPPRPPEPADGGQ